MSNETEKAVAAAVIAERDRCVKIAEAEREFRLSEGQKEGGSFHLAGVGAATKIAAAIRSA